MLGIIVFSFVLNTHDKGISTLLLDKDDVEVVKGTMDILILIDLGTVNTKSIQRV